MAADFIATIDIILRRLRNNCIYLGGVLIISTLDHTQIQAIDGRPFLTSSNIIPMFNMIALQHSVRAADDPHFFRIQQICRYDYRILEQHPEYIHEFKQLCSEHLTFLDNWDHPAIPPSTIRLYSKKVPVREATKQHDSRVKRHYSMDQIRERISDDVERSRFSQQEWSIAREQISIQLDHKVKEPRSLLFFRGAIYVCTFNDISGSFSQSQMALLFELPSQDQLNNWQKVKVLIAPPGTKEIIYHDTMTKQSFIDIGFIECFIGTAKEYTQSLKNNIQGKRKQYGLKPYVSSTIHGAMGDTLPYMVTQISTHDSNFCLWDKGQLVVLLSRTKLAENSMFIGPKNETLNALIQLLTSKTQWSNYIDDVLRLVTVNNYDINYHDQHQTQQLPTSQNINQNSYPFRISDVQLPIVQSGYVYMLISLRHPGVTYIGETICIRTRIQMHNSGNGSRATAPAYLRPFALFAYICGFSSPSRSDLRFYIEQKWKEQRDHLIAQGINDPKRWAYCSNHVIHQVCDNHDRFGVLPSDLKLVCLFEDNTPNHD